MQQVAESMLHFLSTKEVDPHFDIPLGIADYQRGSHLSCSVCARASASASARARERESVSASACA